MTFSERTMPRQLWLLGCLLLSACLTPGLAIPHAPAEEAAQVVFPPALPEQGRQRLDGNTAAAIQLALEDFLPWGVALPAVPNRAPCLDWRQSYDVTVAPAREQGVVLVCFAVNLDVCDPHETIIDVTTYAVDVRVLRILAKGTYSVPRNLPGDPSVSSSVRPGTTPVAHTTGSASTSRRPGGLPHQPSMTMSSAPAFACTRRS